MEVTAERKEGVLIEESDRAVPIDCDKLGFIGSAGLRVVLSTARALKRRNAGFALCSLSDPIREVFRIGGFDQIVAIHPSRAEALASFGS